MLDLRQLLYTLKQEYGFPISLYKRTSETMDLKTGKETIVELKYPIRKAVVLPVSYFLKAFVHVGNPDFKYGGDLNFAKQVFIIDRRDLRDVKVSNDFCVIYNHQRFSIEVLNGFEFGQCYYLVGKEVLGTDTSEQIEVSVQSWVVVTQSAGQTYSEIVSDNVSASNLVSATL